ncbi:MAG: trypsin-like peptidase domain-containing protein [Clostridia bacterium]|nr:trypsin-like peptidase domain-containing protein [Clostridia bacterium]
MEEEKKIEEGAGETPPVREDAVADAASVPEGEPTRGETVEASAPEQEAPTDPPATEAPSSPPPAWNFGTPSAVPPIKDPADERKKKKRGMGAFFAVFGGIFGICVLLLVLTLWLGDEGFQIIRNLYTERVIYVREDDGTSGLLTPNEAADAVKKSTVTISVTTSAGSAIGSGFVYSADGYIITNYHVVESAESTQVLLADGTAYDATVKGFNAAADIAVLKIEARDLVPVTLGSSANLLVGDDVVAIGTPAKLDYAGTSTFGKVSATNRLVSLTDTDGTIVKKMTLIQTDTSVNPGNSGGPLADMYGRVVGVVVMKVSYYGGSYYDGIGFALPIDGVKTIADAIIQKGSFTGVNPIAEGRSLLGVTGHGGLSGYWYSDEPNALTGAMESSETQQEGYHYMEKDGVYVTAINGGDAVNKMQVGDIIMKINGLNVSSVTTLISEANRHHTGETVTLTVWRNGAEIQVAVTLYEASAQ